MTTATLPRSKTKGYSRRYDKLRRSGYYMQVDGTVTRRKLAALQAIGWSLTDLGARIGRTQQALSETFHSTAPIHRTTETLVAKVYDELHLQPQEGYYANRTKLRAKRAGYAPPLAWDSIEDLDETPKGMRK
jgi:lambda repressor-like predicted transcriptional regulator